MSKKYSFFFQLNLSLKISERLFCGSCVSWFSSRLFISIRWLLTQWLLSQYGFRLIHVQIHRSVGMFCTFEWFVRRTSMRVNVRLSGCLGKNLMRNNFLLLIHFFPSHCLGTLLFLLNTGCLGSRFIEWLGRRGKSGNRSCSIVSRTVWWVTFLRWC